MLYRVCKLKFDGWYMYYPEELCLIYASNEEEAIKIYKKNVTVRGRQKVDVSPINTQGVIRIGKDKDGFNQIYIDDKLIKWY